MRVNFQIARPPAASIKGKDILIEPYNMLPALVKSKIKQDFKQYGVTWDTIPGDNKILRRYYGYDGAYWVLICEYAGLIKDRTHGYA